MRMLRPASTEVNQCRRRSWLAWRWSRRESNSVNFCIGRRGKANEAVGLRHKFSRSFVLNPRSKGRACRFAVALHRRDLLWIGREESVPVSELMLSGRASQKPETGHFEYRRALPGSWLEQTAPGSDQMHCSKVRTVTQMSRDASKVFD